MQQRFQKEDTHSASPRSTVRLEVAEAVGKIKLSTLKTKLSDPNLSVRRDAMESLLEQGREGIDILLNIMQEENFRRKTQIRRGVAATIIYFVALATISALFHTSVITSFMFFPLVFIINGAVSPAQQQGVLALAKSSDVRAVPFLLEALSSQQHGVKIAARKGLITLLPQMRLEHANLLTEAHRALLHRYLQKGDSDLQVAILKALEQVGDESSLPILQEILDYPRADSYRGLQEPASQCIDFIRMNVEQVRNAQTLLRASQYTEHQDELLRPAYHTDDTPANELLRPESKPDSK